MDNKLLNRVLRPYGSPLQLLLAGSGLVVGLAVLMLAVQVHDHFARLFNAPESQTGEAAYLVVSKKIGLMHTLVLQSTSFSEREIAALRSQEFADDVGPIIGNSFKISTDPASPLAFYSEFFVEAVPSRFLEGVPPAWDWSEGQPVPALLSNDLLNLYNLVYAPSRGLPPLSRGGITLLTIPFEIAGPQATVTLRGGIVGFSDRVPSILVPESFMAWANARYGYVPSPPPSRLIVKVSDPGAPAIWEYLRHHDYEANQDRLQGSKAASVARTAMLLTGLVGLFLTGLALLAAALNIQLLISRSDQALRLLVDLGYAPSRLHRRLIVRYGAFLGAAVLAAGLCYVGALTWLNRFLNTRGLAAAPLMLCTPGWTALTVLVLLAFACQSATVGTCLRRSSPFASRAGSGDCKATAATESSADG